MRLLLRSAALALVLAPQAYAVSFTFEEIAATRTGGQAPSGGYSSVSSTSDGLTMTVRKVQNKTTPGNYAPSEIFNFDIREFSPAPGSWGARSLDPTFNLASNPNDDDTWWLATFSEPLSSISIEMTDFSPYQDTMRIRAYSGADASGVLVASVSLLASVDSPTFATIVHSGQAAFRSVLFRAADQISANGNLVDNINVTRASAVCDPEFDECPPIPEPAAFVLTGFSVGAAALSAALRKRS